MNEELIKKCEESGMKRWTKGNFDRLYINLAILGFYIEHYKTGNISYAELNGEKISNCRAKEYSYAKTYIDVSTGVLYGTNNFVKNIAKEFYERLRDEVTEYAKEN